MDLSPNSRLFFDQYSEFYKTSKTKPVPNRLNNRYIAMIESNKGIIQNSSILDLGSHDGRWSFAALKNGASKVIGIEGRSDLVESSFRNMEKFEIPVNQYSFLIGDALREIKKIEPEKIDIVFCFGLFYHIMDHYSLLSEIRRINPKFLILDTEISTSDKSVIELRLEDSNDARNALKEQFGTSEMAIAGRPSKTALELMLKNLGFGFSYYDWHSAGITNWELLEDYRNDNRITLVAKNLGKV